jgi:hypothetical protein
MHRGVPFVLALCAVAAGCLMEPAEHTVGWFDALGAVGLSAASDTIVLDVAVIEAEASDQFLAQEIWSLADDQVVPLEQRWLLEENGLRVAQVGGVLPVGLEQRLSSHRTCPDPRRLKVRAGKETAVYGGPTLPHCEFQLRQDGDSIPIVHDDVECVLTVTATPMAEGRTRLRFVPTLFLGKRAPVYKPAADRSGWIFSEDQATHALPLAWEMSLAANEYVIVGAGPKGADALGSLYFTSQDRRRLLTIRLTPAPDSLRAESSREAEGEQPAPENKLAPPLAEQAVLSSRESVRR